MIQLGHVYSTIYLEGPARSLLESWTTFIDEQTQQVISFLDGKGQIYTGLLLYLDPLITQYLRLPSVKEIYTTPYDANKARSLPSDYLVGVTLRDYQIKAVDKALCANRGILELATGAGKTEIACALIKKLFQDQIIRSCVVVTATQYLMDQFYHRLCSRLEGSGIRIGRVGGGYKESENTHVLVGVVDSLYNAVGARSDVGAFVANAECLIADEAHSFRSRSWETVGQACNARYRYGLTPKVNENLYGITPDEYRVIGLLGPVICRIPASVLIQRGYLAQPVISILEVNHPKVSDGSWHRTYRAGIVEHVQRNTLLVNCAATMYERGYKVLVLVTQLKQGREFVRALWSLGLPAMFARGGNNLDYLTPNGWKKEKVDSSDLKKQLSGSDPFILVGSVILDEGFDLPEINCVVLAGGYKKFRRVIQRLGRGMRPKEGENKVYIFDCSDQHNRTLYRHSLERRAVYRSEGHQVVYGLDYFRNEFSIPFDVNREVLWDCKKKC